MKILISYSGGKDSQACLIWAAKEYGVENCEAVFCDTGWENPQTYEHIWATCGSLGVQLVVLKSKTYSGFIDLARKKKRFPSTKARFCTEELKVKPSIDYVLSHDENLIIIEGIRSSESFSRSQMQPSCTYFKYYFEPYRSNKMVIESLSAKSFLTAAQREKLSKAMARLEQGYDDNKYHTYRRGDVFNWTKKYNADRIRPIFDWEAQQVIDYIKDNGQTPNPLYYQGFTRVGCFPCIMSRHGGVKRIIDNFPEQWDKLKEYESELGTTFFPPDYIPNHAKTQRAPGGKVICTAEDVEVYLKRKNATPDMFEEDTPSCMSAYHLCE
jgi:3'-phosphoadenosine 5'-phosphosulfate sulfotransferase (PAPS reductase)/FAD synthetase